MKFHREKDEAKKAEEKEKWMKETLPKFFRSVEKTLSENGGQFLVGDGVSWVDINMACMLECMEAMMKVDWKPMSAPLAAHTARVHALPNIKKWVEKRPNNPF